MKSINTINNIRQIVVNTIESKIDVIFFAIRSLHH